ncbi:MAG: BON domain-containing protein [Pseudobdellovibrionaceae bacterium]
MFAKKVMVTLAVAQMAMMSGSALAAPYETGNKKTTEAENTKINKRDAKDTKQTALTPDIQSKGSPQDVELTRLIRQEITNDKTFSTNAQNIKIITLGGTVTLRGPVETQEEKQRLDALTKKTAGVKKVDNQLEVKSKTY